MISFVNFMKAKFKVMSFLSKRTKQLSYFEFEIFFMYSIKSFCSTSVSSLLFKIKFKRSMLNTFSVKIVIVTVFN